MADYREIMIPKRIASQVPEAGSAPILDWLPIEKLRIDDRYQRQLLPGNWKVITRIASQFKWSRFSPVFVAPIEGGFYAIIDGQHRTHSALVCGFDQVPCQIVSMTMIEQASAFAAVNGNVTKVTNWQIFRAALAAEESWAISLRDVVAAGGCKMMTSNSSADSKQPCEIYSVAQMRRLMEKFPHDVIADALSTFARAEGYNDNPEIWSGHLLLPLLSGFCQRPAAIRHTEFVAGLELWDVWAVVDGITSEIMRRRRLGLPAPSKKEMLETHALEWIDETFPETALLAAPKGSAS